MTRYHTAERTATTPLPVPATPHRAYLLVLLALLAADIATTVWFTGLGLPELNPLLAPIAGDIAAQLVYKAPFAVALLAGTALLAAACDRLVSGAGRYPWLAVAGIYAVPVAWNLVVIAGHTGFHVVPAVVYAPVAVVCAVGVWRAARPRPEALTMPANRPNPRMVTAGLLMAVITIIAFVIAPVSASETGTVFFGDPQTVETPLTLGGVSTLHEIEYFNVGVRVGDHSYPEYITMYYGLLSTTGSEYDAYTIDHDISSSGTLQHNGVDVADVEVRILFINSTSPTEFVATILMTVNEWDTEYLASLNPSIYHFTYTGTDALYSSGVRKMGVYNVAGVISAPSVATFCGKAGAKLRSHTTYASKCFYRETYRNIVYCDYTISPHPVGTGLEISLERVPIWGGGPTQPPSLQVYDSNNTLIFTGGRFNAGYTYLSDSDQIRCALVNQFGKSQTFYDNIGGVPGDAATVTVYVQSSQTGALLANASLSILAAAGGTETEVVNATLPGGTGTYSLEKADYLKYHATATAPGYTLLSPILFGVPEGGTTIILWMAPDAPPDVPTEPEKSMLYGYIQTQGSQQPISGATVALDGYGSTTTSSTGFYLFNNVTPGSYTLTASAPLHDALSEPVTVDPAATPHNLALKGHYLLTVTVKDADDLTNLHNTTISLSDGQESTQNPATFSVDYGPYTITAAASGYYPQTQSAYLDKPGSSTATVLLTPKPEPVPPPEMPNFPPHSVRFLCIDEYNRPLQNVTLRAVYQESTNPVDWFTSWLGLSQSVNINSTTLEGTTGLDGSVIFLMVESVQYRMTVTAPAPLNMTQTFDLYPKEDEITIRFVTSDRPDLSTMPTYDLTATETDPSSVRLALSYHDATNATTSLVFTVTDHATGELIHTETFTASKFPGTVSPSYTVENTKGAMYRFGFEATNTVHGPISQYKGITLNGDGLLVDLGFEDRNLYAWLAVILLFLFAGAFSGTNVKQGAILVPLFGGGLFWFIGWLPITIGGVISAIGFLGVLVYMRKSEWKVRA